MLKIFLQILLALAGLLCVLITIFFFWASSKNYPESDYSQLITNQYQQKEDTDSIYSIVSYNLGYLSGMTNNRAVPKTRSLFNDNLKHVYNEFARINSDVICFQEIDYGSNRSFYVNQQEELQKLGYNHIFQAVNWDVNYLPFPGYTPSMHHGAIYSGQSIISKYPLTEPKRIILERVESNPFYRDAFYLDRLAQVTKISINKNAIVLINVHLEAFDRDTRIKQTQFIEMLYKEYEDKLPVLLVGDFNSDLEMDNATIKTIFKIPGIGSAHTTRSYNEKTFPSSEPTKRIDYIFYNKKFIQETSSKILTSFDQASDHLPIMMEFKLK